MIKQARDVSKAFSIISVLEKSQETRVSLLLFAFVMFLDSALMFSSGKVLYDLRMNPSAFSIDLLFDFVLAFVFFSLFMSIVMLIITKVVRQTLILCFYPIWFRVTYDAQRVPSLWRAGYVRHRKVIEEAHLIKDEYFRELEKEAKEKERELSEQRSRLLLLSISCLVLSAYNFPHNYVSNASLLQHIGRAIPEHGLLTITMLLLVGVFLAVWLYLRTMTSTYIVHLLRGITSMRWRKMRQQN